MINYIMAFLILILASCSSSKNVKQNDTPNTEVNSSSLYRFNVSFISIGTGIDREAKQQFLDFIKEYEIKHNVKIDTETATWGREGEIDYCLKLSELNSDDQRKFISDVKKLLKDNSLVQFSENTECRNKRN